MPGCNAKLTVRTKCTMGPMLSFPHHSYGQRIKARTSNCFQTYPNTPFLMYQLEKSPVDSLEVGRHHQK
jgi:hypothetical protein